MLTDNYYPIDESLQRSMTAYKFDPDLFEKVMKNLLWMMQRKKEVLKAFFLLLVPSGMIVMIKQGKSGKRFRVLMVLANIHNPKAKCHFLVTCGKTFRFILCSMILSI